MRSSVFLLPISGHFYAPEQPGERVLSLSSDQTTNTILVSGDTTGWLQIWDICHFALDIQYQVRRRAHCAIFSIYSIYVYTVCSVYHHVSEVFFFHTARLCAASSAAALEGSQEDASERGSPRGGWQTVRPHSFIWRLRVPVDERRRSRGLFRAGRGVEYHWARYVPEVGFTSLSLSQKQSQKELINCAFTTKLN